MLRARLGATDTCNDVGLHRWVLSNEAGVSTVRNPLKVIRAATGVYVLTPLTHLGRLDMLAAIQEARAGIRTV